MSELTMEQQFALQVMRSQAEQMERSQLIDLTVDAAKLLMIKDNIVRGILKKMPAEPMVTIAYRMPDDCGDAP